MSLPLPHARVSWYSLVGHRLRHGTVIRSDSQHTELVADDSVTGGSETIPTGWLSIEQQGVLQHEIERCPACAVDGSSVLFPWEIPAHTCQPVGVR